MRFLKKKTNDADGKESKYRNRKVEYDGMLFDSKKELKRYIFLKDAEERGVISGLRRQIRYELIPAIKRAEIVHLKTKDKVVERTEQLPITYTCDFCYMKGEEEVFEDVKPSKSMIPTEFTLKAKLFFWKYGKKIRLIFEPNESI